MCFFWWTVWLRDALARQWVLSSSEVRASNPEHGESWVRIPSRAQIFSVSSYGSFFTSPFISFISYFILEKLQMPCCEAKHSHQNLTVGLKNRVQMPHLGTAPKLHFPVNKAANTIFMEKPLIIWSKHVKHPTQITPSHSLNLLQKRSHPSD